MRIELHSLAELSPALDLSASQAYSPASLCIRQLFVWRFLWSSYLELRSRMAELDPSPLIRCGMLNSKLRSGRFSTCSLANFLLLLAPKGAPFLSCAAKATAVKVARASVSQNLKVRNVHPSHLAGISIAQTK